MVAVSIIKPFETVLKPEGLDIMASLSSPFPSLSIKTTSDDKHDMEVFTEDLVDYCVMHNLTGTTQRRKMKRKKARHEDRYLALLAYKNTSQHGHAYSPS